MQCLRNSVYGILPRSGAYSLSSTNSASFRICNLQYPDTNNTHVCHMHHTHRCSTFIAIPLTLPGSSDVYSVYVHKIRLLDIRHKLLTKHEELGTYSKRTRSIFRQTTKTRGKNFVRGSRGEYCKYARNLAVHASEKNLPSKVFVGVA